MSDEAEEEKVVIPTKEECQAMGKKAFDLVQRVRINGALRCADQIADYFGSAPGRFGHDRLKLIEHRCKRADISHGAMYVERGLVYVCSIYETEVGFTVGYVFKCKTADWQDPNALVK
ncbi:MAG: hypothetical protein ACM31L_13095 [Actinomycetota bacterium]